MGRGWWCTEQAGYLAAGRIWERAVALEAYGPGFKAQFYSKTKNVAHHLVLQESSHYPM